jgi:hypothetical protein
MFAEIREKAETKLDDVRFQIKHDPEMRSAIKTIAVIATIAVVANATSSVINRASGKMTPTSQYWETNSKGERQLVSRYG